MVLFRTSYRTPLLLQIEMRSSSEAGEGPSETAVVQSTKGAPRGTDGQPLTFRRAVHLASLSPYTPTGEFLVPPETATENTESESVSETPAPKTTEKTVDGESSPYQEPVVTLDRVQSKLSSSRSSERIRLYRRLQDNSSLAPTPNQLQIRFVVTVLFVEVEFIIISNGKLSTNRLHKYLEVLHQQKILLVPSTSRWLYIVVPFHLRTVWRFDV